MFLNIIICIIIKSINIKNIIICVININIFIIIKSINIKNTIICVINIIMFIIINIINKIINKLEKTLLSILENNHRFDLKYKIFIINKFKKTIITIEEKL